MVQIISEGEGKGGSFASGLGAGLNQGVGMGLQSLAQRRMNEQNQAKEMEKKFGEQSKYLNALDTIKKMKHLGETDKLGFGTSIRGLFSPEARQSAGEYEQLGKSLIAMASSIPIRNQKEFEVLSHNLYDPSINDAKRAGILNAMEKIIIDSMDPSFSRLLTSSQPTAMTATPQRKPTRLPPQDPPLPDFWR